ncbi:MAG: tetratricopeptide repeat protein, partial [Blastocatellia bacterium]|nr:tetratricopeptide repeat protein [Blastocatellia bacterium]
VADYNLVPQGLTMRIYADKTFHLDPAPSLELRGLLDGSIHLDEVATKKLLPNYATMIANRGKYLSVAQRHDEAIEFLQLSLKLLPNFDRTYQFLGDAYAGKGEKVAAEQNYKKALELNPTNKLAQQGLQQLNQLPN